MNKILLNLLELMREYMVEDILKDQSGVHRSQGSSSSFNKKKKDNKNENTKQGRLWEEKEPKKRVNVSFVARKVIEKRNALTT